MEIFCSASIEFRKLLLFFFLAFTVSISLAQNLTRTKTGKREAAFIKNKGQIIDQSGKTNPQVLYLLNTPGLNVQLKKSGFSYDVYEREKKPASASRILEYKNFQKQKEGNPDPEKIKILYHRIDFEFLSTSPNAEILEKGETKAFINYYNIPAVEDGVTGVTGAEKIIYKNLYPKIDLEFIIPEDPEKPVEYNFIIHPGGKIETIKIKISGAGNSIVDGNLQIDLVHGKLKELIPGSWFQEENKKIPVGIEFFQWEENVLGFCYAEEKTPGTKATLTIDPTPVREWATYFGAEGEESYFIGDVVSDAEGFATIIGYTTSTANLATTGSHQDHLYAYYAPYLARFDPEGNLLWSTYYGGSLGATFSSLSLDPDQNIIAVGNSASPDNVSTPGSHQSTLNDSETNENYGDGIIVKFNSNGVRLWGTYFGGESFDQLIDVTTDVNGTIYTVGATASHNNISTPGSFKEIGDAEVHHHWNGIFAKFSKNGDRIWATFYMGEEINQVATDSRGNIYFTGSTYSMEGIATPGAYHDNLEYDSMTWTDAFLAKFNPGGERLWGTYFGGNDYEFGQGLTIDSQDNIIIAGQTRSKSNIATPGAHQEEMGGDFLDWDAYLAKFNASGQILWSTFYGGPDSESWGHTKVEVDINDNIFLFGNTSSKTNISTPGAFQENKNTNADVFLTKFNQNGARQWGTYYGGNSSEYSLAIDVNVKGEIFLVGWTYSTTGIATPGSHQEFNGGLQDEFLVKLKDCTSSNRVTAPAGVCEGEDLEFAATGGLAYRWSGPNGFSSTISNPVIHAAGPEDSGEYSVFISSGDACDNTRTFQVVVSAAPVAHPVGDITACEDEPGTGIATSLDLSNVEAAVLQGQTGMEVSWYDEAGDIVSGPGATYTNTKPHKETFTLRVAGANNPSCYAETSFDLLIHPLPQITAMADLWVCDTNPEGFSIFQVGDLEKEITGNDAVLKAIFLNSSGEELDFSGTFQNTVAWSQTISVQVVSRDTGCYSEFEFDLLVHKAPVAHSLNDLIGCDSNGDGISEYFDVSGIENAVLQGQTGLQVSYLRSDGSEIPTMTSPYTNAQPYEDILMVVVSNPETGCYAETPIRFKTSAAPSLNIPETMYGCDQGDGFGNFDTSSWDHNIIGDQSGLNVRYYSQSGDPLPTPLPSIYRNTVANTEKIKAKVENELNASCSSEISFNLRITKKQELDLELTYNLCDLEPFLKLSPAGNFDSWEWKNASGTIISNTAEVSLTEAGNYSVSVSYTENGITCENSYFMKLIRSQLPAIREVKSQEWSSSNYIEIIAGGDPDLEYSIDGQNFQDSNYFSNIPGGSYTVFARDKMGCGVASYQMVILDYPKFFSPNYDGQNDLWQIKGLSAQLETKVHIYDRYGKLLKEISSHGPGWDGTFNGRIMPTDDYWFTLYLEDGRVFKNHFSLLR